MSTLKDAAMNTMAGCMAIKKGESVLVICDEPERRIGLRVWEAAKELGPRPCSWRLSPAARTARNRPLQPWRLHEIRGCALCPTSRSLTHTDARRAATDAGVRAATLPGITEDCMVRTLTADYTKIAERSVRMAEVLSAGKKARVTSPAGTNIEFSIEGRTAHADTGLVHKPGDMSNLPAGEAYLAPVEGTANGVIIFEAAVAGLGKLGKETIRIKVEDGYAAEITGGGPAAKLNSILEPHGKDAYNIAELGVGTNDKAIISGMILEDEKILGTVHMALGDNKSMGGTVGVSSHIDGLITRPTVLIDGREIMKDGRLLV